MSVEHQAFLVNMPLNWDDDHMLSSQLRCIVTRDGTSSLHYCEKDGASGTGWSDLYPMSITTGTALRFAASFIVRSGNLDSVLALHRPSTAYPVMDVWEYYLSSLTDKPGSSHTLTTTVPNTNISTPAMLTKKLNPTDHSIFTTSTNEILEHHRSDVLISWKQNTVQEELDYEPTYVTSCLNNQGIWVFVQDNKPETERKTHVYMRRHGDSTFSEICQATIEGVCFGVVSSWMGAPRMFVVLDHTIFEYWYDREDLVGPILVCEKYTGLLATTSSVAFQREIDTPQGHRPETVTVVFRINSGKVLARVWTTSTKEWKDGGIVLDPSEQLQ